MNNQSLTDAQRERIEESKRRALALRAKRKSLVSDSYKSTTRPECSNVSSKLTDTGLQFQRKANCQDLSISYSHSSNFKPAGLHQSSIQSKHSSSLKSISSKTSFHQATTISQNSNTLTSRKQFPSLEVPKDKFYGLPERKVIKGKCVLISKDRFCVNVGYHGPLIEYFKQMETRGYDTSSRTWSFQLKEYDKLLKGIVNFQPHIVVEPLPPIVVQTFCVDDADITDNGIEEVCLSSVDDTLVKTLMPFQKEGVYFALHHSGRILLADEMGLGKTLQALCIAQYYRSEWPLLIVTPSSVRFDWAQQIYKWLPSVDPQEVNVVDSGKRSVKEGLVSIISYDLMPKKIQELKERRFKVIIMDESHFLKNAKAIRTKAAALISKMAKRIILLSGTPALSRPSELFTQICAVCPSMFKLHDFGMRYCAAKQQPWGWDYSGSSNLEELQHLLEKKIMIRRLKSNVLEQLPDKTRQVIILNPVLVSFNKDLNQALKVVDKASLKSASRRGALLQYFHETCKAKLRAVKDFILDLIESDKKFLVFAHHKEMMDCIEDAVSQHGKIKHIRIDGSTKSEHRSQLCRKFQSQEEYRVAVLSITAANAGLNLSAANLVVFAELFWNPGILIQAEDRVHRIGQKSSVSVQYLVAKKTADDFVWPLVQDKLNILTKAGLTKDCFSDADTQHALDRTQSSIMDMFKHDFIEESSPDPPDVTVEELGSKDTNSCAVTPGKLKRQRSSSSSPFKCDATSSQDSPRKKQLLITKFVRNCEEESSGATTSTDNVVGKDYVENCFMNRQNVTNVNEADCFVIDEDIVGRDKDKASCKGESTAESALLSMEDCEALGDLSWEEELWD